MDDEAVNQSRGDRVDRHEKFLLLLRVLYSGLCQAISLLDLLQGCCAVACAISAALCAYRPNGVAYKPAKQGHGRVFLSCVWSLRWHLSKVPKTCASVLV